MKILKAKMLDSKITKQFETLKRNNWIVFFETESRIRIWWDWIHYHQYTCKIQYKLPRNPPPLFTLSALPQFILCCACVMLVYFGVSKPEFDETESITISIPATFSINCPGIHILTGKLGKNALGVSSLFRTIPPFALPPLPDRNIGPIPYLKRRIGFNMCVCSGQKPEHVVHK